MNKKPLLKLNRSIAVVLWLWAGLLIAHEVESLRIEAGIDLLPSFLAADLDIAGKAGPDGALSLLLVYKHDRHEAEHVATALEGIKRIRGLPIRVLMVSIEALSDYLDSRPAGVFVAERLPAEALAPVLAFGRQAGVLVISPHEGDVEQGASGGISVSDRILPYVNVRALNDGGIRLKPFFLRITEKYDG